MALNEGLHLVTFRTPLGVGSGVAFLTNGRLHGGDSIMAYVGEFRETDGNAEVDVRVFRHTNRPGTQSVLGANSATLKLSGEVDGDTARLSGPLPQAPGSQLTVSLSPLKE